MDRKGLRAVPALCAAIVLVLPLLGCADADPIGSSVGGVTVKIVPSGGSGRYSAATWGVGAINLLPVDPIAQGALGGQVLTLTGSLLPVDLTGADPATSVMVTLASGTYEISTLQFINLSLQGWQSEPPPTTCYDLVSSPPLQPSPATLTVFTPPLRFTVSPKGTHNVELRIDAPALIDAYLTSWECSGGSLSNYDGGKFAQALYPGVVTLVQTQ